MSPCLLSCCQRCATFLLTVFSARRNTEANQLEVPCDSALISVSSMQRLSAAHRAPASQAQRKAVRPIRTDQRRLDENVCAPTMRARVPVRGARCPSGFCARRCWYGTGNLGACCRRNMRRKTLQSSVTYSHNGVRRKIRPRVNSREEGTLDVRGRLPERSPSRNILEFYAGV